jgi:hypothetical protein
MQIVLISLTVVIGLVMVLIWCMLACGARDDAWQELAYAELIRERSKQPVKAEATCPICFSNR